MAGLRIVWINDTDANNPTAGTALALPAYRRIGEWAFGQDDTGAGVPAEKKKWKSFLKSKPDKRLLTLSKTLCTDFLNKTPTGAPNVSPRVLILYDNDGPTKIEAKPAGDTFYGDQVREYYSAHELRLLSDGFDHTNIVFDGNPSDLNFNAYLDDYKKDEGEGNTAAEQEKQRKRILRIFAMTLFTRCR